MRVGERYRWPMESNPVPRPELRRQPRDDVAVYRIRVDLDDADPPIWRRLDLRSDLPLDVVHQVLQTAFDWTDSHLHRFSLGGLGFDMGSQLFLCPYDLAEGEPEDDGPPASAVRLDETLQEPGDVLHYLYDYGDAWELTLRLEKILPAPADASTATAVAGGRAAPPEDCGGRTDAASLAEVLQDPARFELDEINRALRGPYFVLRDNGVDERLLGVVDRLGRTSAARDVADRMTALISEPTTLSAPDQSTFLRAYQWFLDRSVGNGIALTSAGYLKPGDVTAASEAVPAMGDWIGKNNREVNCRPLLDFRQSLQHSGLLRKYKGTLVLTRAGAAAQRDPAQLWNHLASRLLQGGDEFETQATLLLLVYAGTSANAELPLDRIASVLTELGWRHGDGRPLEGHELYRLSAFHLLENVSDRPVSWRTRNRLSTAAAALARAALCRRRVGGL